MATTMQMWTCLEVSTENFTAEMPLAVNTEDT